MGLVFSGLFDKLFGKQEFKILMIGLDAAGKTAILYHLKLGEIITCVPTIGFNVETIKYKNIAFTLWDISGQGFNHHLWKYYYQDKQGIIFVVDSDDRERMSETRARLISKVLQEDETKNIPILVFFNKQDLPNAIPVSELTEMLGLAQHQEREWYVQACCATSGDGLYEGLDWLSSRLAERKTYATHSSHRG